MSESQPEKKLSETARREEAILSWWKENGVFEKSLEKKAPNGEFVFYDGPPFATGLPHHGSLLSSIIKDVVPRYKTMQGYRVRRVWGWDCHGLPIETLVEKELGLKTKKDIETIGVKAFNEKAKSMVLTYVRDWEVYVERVGRWVDFKNSYKTMDNSYIESVWWALKQLWEKELLYEGRRVLMYCPHCETPLAKAEIAMDNTYKDITEEAVTVKFKIENGKLKGLPENTFILAWTTTPWTLPGNVALAVGKDIDYSLCKNGEEHIIMAEAIRAKKHPALEVEKTMKGSELLGIAYEPLYAIAPVLAHNGPHHIVLAADFVSTEEGTGVVHTAVMYGEDDFTLGQKENLPMVQLLRGNGSFTDDAPEFVRGKYIKDAEKDIKRDLETRGLMYERKNNTHSYPHCYRCDTPLIYNAVPSWFLGINKIPKGGTETVKARMLAENEKVNWVPEHLKHGRFQNIVENAPDWTISRNRFWASPLPAWRSEKGDIKIIGSIDELKSLTKTNGNAFFLMRHGESVNVAENIISRDLEGKYPLTEKGRSQVLSASETLKGMGITKIVSSPVKRAKESAEMVARALGMPLENIIVDERLREFDVGDFDGVSVSEFFAWREKSGYREKTQNGESYYDAKKRIAGFLVDADSKMEGERMLIVSHGIAFESLLALCEGANDERSREIIFSHHIPPAAIEEIPYTKLPLNDDLELDLHRPYIDDIVLIENGVEYKRTPEVVDCWVESGSMPFAEYNYPFQNEKEFLSRAPGDFIAEYIAQTRTWFYYMHAIGVMLFDRRAFKNVVTTGTILAKDGEKISKSKRNYTDPLLLIGEYGADALRFTLMQSPVMQAEDVRFRDEDVRDAHNKVIQMLWNCYKFFELSKNEIVGTVSPHASTHPLDIWILARLDETLREVTQSYEAYIIPPACRAIKNFIDDYSTWYVRRSRDRVKGNDSPSTPLGASKQQTLAVQRHVLLRVAEMLAPVTPFIAESVYRGVSGERTSVHLAKFPKVKEPSFFNRAKSLLFSQHETNERSLKAMHMVRSTVSRALEARDKAGIRVRQPLSKLEVSAADFETLPQLSALLEIIADEINVKEVAVSSGVNSGEVMLDTHITDALQREGLLREVIRAIQGARKTAGLKPGVIAKVTVKGGSDVKSVLQENEMEIKSTGSIAEITFEEGSVLEAVIV